MKHISLLGSTGSIGQSTLRVVRHLKEELKIVALAARSNLDLLEAQVREFNPLLVAVGDGESAQAFQRRVPHIPVLAGMEGLCAVASIESASFTMLAMAGSAGLQPAIAAIQAGKTIGLANKEILICGGELIMRKAREKKVSVIPVDSEHSALFQCLQGNERGAVRRMILTASGGPFRTFSSERLSTVSVQDALAHPTWKMGAKVTVDSSTLMNKGLEMIEAHYLFDLPGEAIEAVIHPQSRVHSFVEYCDGSILAQIAESDMTLPIQYALTYPTRRPGLLPPFDFLKNPEWTFAAPDKNKFPCLRLAEEALRLGRSYPCALNAANEVLVDRFLKGEHGWGAIGAKLEKLISSHSGRDMITLESILGVDREMRQIAKQL